MKIALIRRKFAAVGGAELYLQRLLRALAGTGHEVHLFAEQWQAEPPDVTLHPIPSGGPRSTRPARFAEAVHRLIAREPFDCVFSLERTVSQDVYRAGDGLHRVWLEQRRRFAPWWKKPFVSLGGFHRTMTALESRTFDPETTGRIIVNSEMVRREIVRHFSFPEDRIHLVRNGVDTAHCQSGHRMETRRRFGVKEDEFLLLFAGSGWERKGLRHAIRALEALNHPKVKLLVAGKGRKLTGVSSQVIFAGPMPDIENAYAAADLFLFLPIYEPSANVCFEALAAGLPVVTTAQNGAGEVIEPGVNGHVVADASELAAVVHAIRFWMDRRGAGPVPSRFDVSLERNVAETLKVLELAAKEKRLGIADEPAEVRRPAGALLAGSWAG